MNSFRNHRLRDLTLSTSTAWLLTDIAEAKGQPGFYTRQSPQILNALRDTATIQSAESSNYIEGVTVDRDRLRPLIQRQPGEFSVADLQKECPRVSLDVIRHLLDCLRKNKKGKSLGTGRNARWHNIAN